MRREWVVLSREHLGVETLHGLSPERRHLHYHLVEDTACRPHITPIVVGHVLPNFWAGIIRGSGLGSHHAAFDDS